MAQFGSAGKNPPWARTATDFANQGGMNQQMMASQGVTSQAVFNLAAQQNLQSQYQAQQMAAATMQNAMQQQQAMLPQPGIAMPTSLASANMGTVSYPNLKTQQQQQHIQQQQRQRVFTGTVTKLHDNFGFVDEDVFFQTTCVKGPMPKVGDRVLVEAQFNANMPFKWNATSVKMLGFQNTSQQSNTIGGSKFSPGMKSGFGNQMSNNQQQTSLMGQSSASEDSSVPTTSWRASLKDSVSHVGQAVGTDAGKGGRDRSRSGTRGFDRDRQRRREDRDRHERDRKQSDKETEQPEGSKKRSRSPKRSTSPKRSHSPPRRRPRIAPRYVVQVPKVMLNLCDAGVVVLKSRFNNMYIPSDFFHSKFPWHEAFPLLRPFQLGKPCQFHVMHKDVERVGLPAPTQDPADADHLYNAKVMLIASPSIDDLYHKSCSLSQDPESTQENFVHPTRLINFLVGVKGKNEPMAIGGPWSPSMDGPNPADDPKTLIKTAIRTTKSLTGINLSSCTQWYRFAEVHYLRPEETHRGKVVPARVETTVIFLPDVWSCQPTHLEWETLQLSYKKQLLKKLSQLDGKEETQEEEDESEELSGEKKEPTNYAELDPKSMKIVDLKRELECRNLSSKGLKSQLMARLAKVLKTEQEKEDADEAEKSEQPEVVEEEEQMETEVDEETKKKEQEERKKEEEKKRGIIERRYVLPDKASILVYPNASAKGGKFDCSVMSLSVLLDYRPEDNKEHSFEVSLFAELFNEMLMRDFGFNIYKALSAAPEKPKEEKKDKEKEKEKEKDKKKDKEEDSKKKKDDKKESDKKDDEKKDSKDSDDKKDDKKDKDDEKKRDKEDKKERKEKKSYMTVKPDLLLSCIYFDQNHCGYLLDRDLEEVLHAIGLALSRAQVKKLIQKCTSRDSFHYRKLTDVPLVDEDKAEQKLDLDMDLEQIAAGNMALLVKKESAMTPSRKKGSKKDEETLSGMVMYNGAMVDIDSVLERLGKGEKSLLDLEKKLADLEEDKAHAKRDLKKREDTISKLTADNKSLKQDLNIMEKNRNTSESNNKKYLSALVETNGILNTLVTTVTGVLGDTGVVKKEKAEATVKEDKSE